MRLALAALIGTLLFQAALMAADPLEGTWNLNVQKSKGMDQTTSDSRLAMALKIESVGSNRYRQTIEWGNPTRHISETIETTNWDGKDYENDEGDKPDGYTMSIQRIDNGHILAIFKKNGKEYSRSEMSVSPDGQVATMHQWGTGRRTAKPFDLVLVYEKQQ